MAIGRWRFDALVQTHRRKEPFIGCASAQLEASSPFHSPYLLHNYTLYYSSSFPWRKSNDKYQHSTKTKSTELNSLYLDKVPKGDMQLILDLLLATDPSSSILAYTSPQSLVTKDTSHSAFLLDNHHLLSMIVIDEIHLLTDFGRLFRAEINMLKDELLNKVKETKPMLSLTATCTKLAWSSLENLVIGVTCNSLHWPSPLGMMNRKVRIEVLYTPL